MPGAAVYFVTEGDRGVAYWRGAEDAADEFLCSIELKSYDNDSHVRDLFSTLVSATAAHHKMRFTVEVVAPASRLAGLPCESCTAPAADDIRHRAGQISDVSELRLSPSGFPEGCCKVKTVAAFGTAGHGASAAR
jgi:hypothetical protein